MNDTRQEPVPMDLIGQIRALARDLAYGALVGDWSSKFVMSYGDGRFGTEDYTLKNYLATKWNSAPPNLYLLVSFGYMRDQRREPVSIPAAQDRLFTQLPTWEFVLTEQAFALLQQPDSASVFISYRRGESSALALLLLARFRAMGLEPFLDMNIEPGSEWHAQLMHEVHRREYFVALVGPRTLESPYVRDEIVWALAAGARIMPVWHNGFDDAALADLQVRYPELEPFFARQAIRVEQENPIAYEGAIIQLLNRFGMMA